jgi:hypothetical protein
MDSLAASRICSTAGARWQRFRFYHHRRSRTLGELRKSYHKKLSEFFAARFRKTLRGMRCTISRRQSPRLDALSAWRKQQNPATEAGLFGVMTKNTRAGLLRGRELR